MINEDEMIATTNLIANNNNFEVDTSFNNNYTLTNSPYLMWKSYGNDLQLIKNKIVAKYGKEFNFNVLSNIINNNFSNDLSLLKNKNWSVDKIDSIKDDIGILINFYQNELVSYDGNSTKKEYKFRNLFSFYNNLMMLPKIKSLIEDNTSNYLWLLSLLIKIDKSQYLIFNNLDIEKVLKNMKDIECAEFYYNVSVMANLPTFLKIDKLLDNNIKKYIFDDSKSVLAGASRNSDIRVIKYILNNMSDYYSDDLHLKSSMSYIISGCFSSNIPIKFSLKRLRFINDHINLSPYFELMIRSIKSYDVLIKLNKYYGKEKNFVDNTYYLISELIFSINPETDLFYDTLVKRVNETMNIFNKLEHKSKFGICIFSRTFRLWGVDPKLILNNIQVSYIYNLVEEILDKLSSSLSILDDSDILELFKHIDRKVLTYSFNNYLLSKNFNSYNDLNNNGIRNLIFYIFPYINYFESTNLMVKDKLLKEINLYKEGKIKFNENKFNNLKNKYDNFAIQKISIFISLNKLKLLLKIYCRKFIRLLGLTRKLDLMNRINFVDSKDKSCDSIEIQKCFNNYRHFNSVPPRHVMLNELYTFNGKEAIIREKADGYMVDCFPNDIEPSYGELFMNKLKVEFIEDLDLYLVFDIDLEFECDIDRYDYLRSCHDFTKKFYLNKEPINSFDELKDHILEENKRFEQFLSLPYTSYRWYPKGAWKIKFTKEFINSLNMVCSLDYKPFYTGKIQFDGYILSLLEDRRELKVKPLEYQTIDLIYRSDKNGFYDRDNYCWNSMIDFNISNLRKKGMTLMDSCIYRLVPILDVPLVFGIESNRFDKKNANSNKIVNSIVNFITFSIGNNIPLIASDKESNSEAISYYPKTNFYDNKFMNTKSEYWKALTDKQNFNLNNYIKKLLPEKNKNWLDLGCGSSKLLRFINRFNYNNYLGIDNDYNQLLLGLNKIDKYVFRSNDKSSRFNESKVRLVHSDLKDISENVVSWDSLNSSNKVISNCFDYIVSNFSISHFVCDKFWEYLKTLVKPDTKFLFNCLNENIIRSSWIKVIDGKESYVKYNEGKVRMKFEIHDEEVTEEYLPFTEIKNYLDKYGWKIILKSNPSGDDLDSYYDWYIITLDK